MNPLAYAVIGSIVGAASTFLAGCLYLRSRGWMVRKPSSTLEIPTPRRIGR